ncbi:MAG: acyl carrier protein [Candidatus Angelobacter sp. Gp1-AA117]|nr:MAG: acyl carrier protein [Candidatus Angelobacter sp. Gp1-AA117]
MSSVEERVRRIVADQLGIDPSEIKLSASLEALGADSLDAKELAMALEEEFGLKFRFEDEFSAGSTATMAAVVGYIEKNAKSVQQ